MKQSHIFIAVLILLSLFLGNSMYGQLPLPEDFCSKAKKDGHSKRTASIDYANYDAYDVHFYHLNLWVETDDTFIKGKVLIHAQSISNALDTIYLELSNELEIQQVLLNDQEVNFQHNEGLISILSPQIIENEEFFIIEVNYEGEAISSQGRGYMSTDSRHDTRVNWTLSEPFYAKDWWPCKQHLEDKADSVWVFVSTSNKNKVGSNGLLTASIPLENDQVRYEWKSKYPIAYYLISIALAEYMEYSFLSTSEEGKELYMLNYLYPDSLMYKSQKAFIDCTHVQMNLLQEKYGEYPFIEEKYGHCITPIGGGMEHQTMTTQRDFQFHLTIHEMGHSWFGNQVTCATWNHIWINEGFATYTQYLGLENLANRASADAFMAALQDRVMRLPDGSVYVPDEYLDDRDRIFSGRLSYYKGAVIIHMIRYVLDNDELFFHVLQEFQSRYAYQTATAEDFKEVLEELSQKDFDTFFDLWYYGEGFPVYQFNWKQSANGFFELYSQQESSTPKAIFFPMKFDVQLYFTDGTDSIIQVEQNQAVENFNWVSKKFIKDIIPNPGASNLMKVKSIYSGSLVPGEVHVEPNPAQDFVLLRFANSQSQRILKIYNASLQLIEQMEIPDKMMMIPVNDWSSGIYFLKIQDGNQEIIKKIIKI